MRVNVIYDHGKLVWPGNLKPKDDKFPVIIQIADEDIKVDDYLDSIDDPKLVKTMKDIRAIRGTSPRQFSDKSDKELFFDALSSEIKETGKI